MSADIIRLADHGRPYRPHVVPVDGWCEREMRESLRRVFGTPLRAQDVLGDLPSDSQPPEGAA